MNRLNANAQVIGKKNLFQYGFLALPVAFAGFPLYVLLPDFYASHYGLSLSLLGTIFFGIRLFDAIQDPMIGWLSDKFQNRIQNFVVGAAALLCFAIFGLFNGMIFSPVIWLILCMTLAVSSYSILTIILGTYATLWTTDQIDQTRISSSREFFGLIGLLIAVSTPTGLAYFIDKDHIYMAYTTLLSFLMIVGIITFLNLPKSAVTPKTCSPSPLSGLSALPRESLYLLFVYGISMLASSIPAVLVIFFIRDLLGAEHLAGLYLLLYFLSGAAGMPLWKTLSSRFGKYKAWTFSQVLAVTAFIGAFFLGNGDTIQYAIICIASGFALGADLTLPPSILADHVHKNNNSAYSGTHYALLAFAGKASLAFASATALPILDASGFKPQGMNSEETLIVLSLSYALIPCSLKILSAILIYYFFIRYKFGGHHDIIQNSSSPRSSHHA